jgi:hypothetical protein
MESGCEKNGDGKKLSHGAFSEFQSKSQISACRLSRAIFSPVLIYLSLMILPIRAGGSNAASSGGQCLTVSFDQIFELVFERIS